MKRIKIAPPRSTSLCQRRRRTTDGGAHETPQPLAPPLLPIGLASPRGSSAARSPAAATASPLAAAASPAVLGLLPLPPRVAVGGVGVAALAGDDGEDRLEVVLRLRLVPPLVPARGAALEDAVRVARLLPRVDRDRRHQPAAVRGAVAGLDVD